MAKRIGIARAIALDPEWLMYDEPFSGLESIRFRFVSREEVRKSTDPLVFQYVNERPNGPVWFHYPAVAIDEDFGISSHSKPAPGVSR
ncbi:MAG: hypothetical protein A3E79_18820 [Burkholderiales bacterium RIFCSPHIGHO2_12_FULL_61_11]|nr:MAG: hypothetical protein A3E79_18820 [Burkholderiales bacterium RIFCSPHIGHO2_12_FULL_61_11]